LDAELRTLPPNAVLLAFYLLPDGTGIADFFGSAGDFSSFGDCERADGGGFIARTLEANVPQVRRAENPDSWTGSGDAGGTSGFDRRVSWVATKPAAVPAKPAVTAAGANKAPATAPAAAPAKLTPEKAPGKTGAA